MTATGGAAARPLLFTPITLRGITARNRVVVSPMCQYVSVEGPLALYLSFLDGEGGAEGYAAAVTRDQARILFDTAREMVRRAPEIRRCYGVEALANAIWQERTSSNLRPISSDAKALDGLNVQIAVCDEIASHKTSEVYDVLLTAMGEASPSDAAGDIDGHWEQRRYRQAIVRLRGAGARRHPD